jgi:hypothetical protein
MGALRTLLPVVLAMACAATESATMKQPVTVFDGNRIWKRYERLFDSVREASSPRKLDSLESKVDSLSDDLASAVEDRGLVADLEVVLRSELERRRDQVDVPRGQPEEPDSVLILQSALVRLEADRRVAEALLDAGVDDVWARSTVFTSLGQSIATVEDHVGLVKGYGRAAEAADTLAEAEAKLGPARAVLQRAEVRP